MKTIAQRVRELSSGYQGMDDQAAVAREVEKLEALSAWQAQMLERA